MAGLKEPRTAGTSDCAVMLVHILVVGRQALANHISLRPGNAPSGLCPESPEGGVRFVRGYVTYETTLPSVGA